MSNFKQLLEQEMRFSVYQDFYKKITELLNDAANNMSFNEFAALSADVKQAADDAKSCYFQVIRQGLCFCVPAVKIMSALNTELAQKRFFHCSFCITSCEACTP